MKCSVCDNAITKPIYEAASEHAITSLSQIVNMRTRVWLCENCSHLNSDPMPDNQSFYAFDYQISVGSDDEDQVYEVRGNDIVYRGQHQARVFAGKVSLAQGARVLDFGCAKASMMRRLKDERPDVQIHLFDVSKSYEAFWQSITPLQNQAVHELPGDWKGSFDLVTSYFSLEHIPDPVQAATAVHGMLAPGGVFYAVVPYALTNIGDFIVVDHVNHFTKASLTLLLQKAGFGNVLVDAESHRGALVVSASKSGTDASTSASSNEIQMSKRIAEYWQLAGQRLREKESAANSKSAAIYGAGFYGMYVFSVLAQPDRIHCFVDKSPFLRGKTASGVPIVAPEDLDDGIDLLYVAVNPTVAQSVVSSLRDGGVKLADFILLEPFSGT